MNRNFLCAGFHFSGNIPLLKQFMNIIFSGITKVILHSNLYDPHTNLIPAMCIIRIELGLGSGMAAMGERGALAFC